ncbi:MAG TPA: hypothetical protein VGJ78_05810 [Vicinamibacterales bacterium]|jgi:hypothetical protein
MKILFSVGNFGFLRNFEPALRLFAEHGHDLHLVAERKDSVGGTRTLELLQSRYPDRIRFSYAPSRKDAIWQPLAVQLRLSLDYWRYLDPRYDHSPSLRARGASQAPAVARMLVRPRVMRTRPALALLRALVRTCERAIPPGGRVEAFLRTERPDLLLLTPLLYFGSQQVEYVRAAHAMGIRTALGVGSWDHLTTKGLIHAVPRHVLVWNDAQREEAFELHGIPPERITVNGAQAYDHWFVQQPSLSRAAFCAKVGIPHDGPLLLYLCSSPFITPHEVPFVRRWIEAIRASADPVLRGAAILIRPHPQNAEQWSDFNASAYEAVGIWPRAGANPVDAEARAEYFDSMFYSRAVVGVNTSALIESGIVGRPVYTVLADDFAGQQEGTLHFQHLKNVNGGLLTTAATLNEHVAQLAEAVHRQPARDEKSEAFIRAFVRPYGLDVPAAERFVDAIERQMAQPAPARVRRRLWQRGLTFLMRPVALAAAAQARARRTAKDAKPAVGTTRPARFLFAVSSPEFLRYFDSTMEALVQRGHHVSVAVNWLRERKKARLDELILEPRIEVAGVIPKRGDLWTPLARAVRGTMDFARYLDPRFAEAPALRARMVRKSLPTLLEPLNRIRSLSVRSVNRLQRILQRVERAIPVGRPLSRFLDEQQPDVVIVSPLVDASSDQVDLVRASQAAGITTVAAIASWDNLTNKGHMRVVPDLVTVWNERQREEATTLHGIPSERVAVTGAQLFDRWFERRPSQSREDFCAMVGLPADRPIVLYTGSSVFIARSEFEVPFVRRWMATLRSSGPPLLREAAILVRPHPFNCDSWEHADFTEFGPVSVWPRQRYTPAAEEARNSFFDSLYYSAAVVGINTSAMIEAAILGKPVLSLMTGDFAGTQEGTLHFRYLLPENGGFLRVASTLDDHAAQLADVLRDPEVTRAQTLRFVEHFLRPHGMDKPCTPILVEALEGAAAQGPRVRVREGLADKSLRVVVAPLAMTMRASDRLTRLSVEKVAHRVKRDTRRVTYEGYASVKRAAKLTYGRVLKKPSRRALKALRVIFSR